MAVYTKFNQNEIEKILSNYNLGKLNQFKGIEEGIENTNYFLSLRKKLFLQFMKKELNQKIYLFFQI